MKNTFGTNLCVTLFGESHGEEIGAVLDGLCPGLPVDEDFIASQLSLRRPAGSISTARREEDRFRIVSGVFDGKTTGTPLCILIPNENTDSGVYDKTRYLARPGHADYTAYAKYHGYEDHRGGGHFSGRLTAPLVAAGAILLPALDRKGITVGTHISRLGEIADDEFTAIPDQLKFLNHKDFAVLNDASGERMKERIRAASEAGDSIGGILETAVTGLPAGLGEPWFDTVEGLLSHALFGIPGIKGVQFGIGFDGCSLSGSQYNDAFRTDGSTVTTETNHNGGINGGITNGMPLLFRCAVKPTPSVFTEQETVDFKEKTNGVIALHGRHDPAIIHRARVVVDSVTAIVLTDLLQTRFGTDYLIGEQ